MTIAIISFVSLSSRIRVLSCILSSVWKKLFHISCPVPSSYYWIIDTVSWRNCFFIPVWITSFLFLQEYLECGLKFKGIAVGFSTAIRAQFSHHAENCKILVLFFLCKKISSYHFLCLYLSIFTKKIKLYGSISLGKVLHFEINQTSVHTIVLEENVSESRCNMLSSTLLWENFCTRILGSQGWTIRIIAIISYLSIQLHTKWFYLKHHILKIVYIDWTCFFTKEFWNWIITKASGLPIEAILQR